MEQTINNFINTICDLQKEPNKNKKRPIGFFYDEDDPFIDSKINRILEYLGHDERRGMTITHEIKYYLESLVQRHDANHPKRKIKCGGCGSDYIFHVIPQMRHALRFEDDFRDSMPMHHVMVNCNKCDHRLVVYDVEKIIKIEVMINPHNPTEELLPSYNFDNDRGRNWLDD